MNSSFENKKISELYFYCTIVLVPVGLIMNLSLFIGYNSNTFSKGNIGFQIRITSIICSLAYFWNIVVYRYLNISFNIDDHSIVSCILVTFVARVLQQMPFYLLTQITYLNYVSVVSPARHKRLNQKHKLKVSLVMIVIGLSLLNVFSAIKYIETANYSNKTQNELIGKCTQNPTIANVSTIIASSLRFVFPFIINIVIQTLTVKELINQKLAINATIEDEKKLIVVFVVFNLIFFLLNFPLTAAQILSVTFNGEKNSSNILRSAYEIVRIIAWNSYIVAFFLNIFLNKMFRNSFWFQMKKIVCRR